MTLFEKLKKNGKLHNVKDNTFNHKSGKDKAFIVIEGSVDVYICNLNNDNISLKKYMFTLSKNMVYFSFDDSILLDKYTIYFSSDTNTKILKTDINELLSDKIIKEHNSEMTQLIEQWIFNWLIYLNGKHNKDPIYNKDIAIIWSKKKDGAYYPKMNSNREEEICNNNYQKTKDVILNKDFMEVFKNFYIETLSSKFRKLNILLQKEKVEFYKKFDLEENMLQDAFEGISNIINMKDTISFRGISDDTYKALKYVLEYEKIDVNILTPKNEKDTSYNKVVEMAQSAQLKFRTVTLPTKWWEKDIGSFVGFKKDTGKAVTLIMVSAGKYKVFEPEEGHLKSFEENIKDLLEERVVVVYRAFPNKAIKIWEILKFSILNIRKKDLVTLILSGIIVGILSMVLPITMGEIFDFAIPSGERSLILQIVLLLIAVQLSKTFLEITRFVAIQRIEMILDNSIEHAVWDRLLGLPVRFFRKFSSGEINSKIMGISEIRTIITGASVATFLEGFFLLFNFGLMLYYSKVLAIFAMMIILVFVIINFLISYLVFRIEKKEIEIRNKLYGYIYQLIRGITKIKVANAENRAFYKWSVQFTNLQRVSFKADFIGNILSTFISIVPIVSSCILFFLVIQDANNELSVGKFIAFYAAFSILLNGMINISSNILSFAEVFPIYNAVKPILTQLKESNDNKPYIRDFKGNVNVHNLSFRYSEKTPLVIKDVSFNIKEGEYVAFVGASGSGKSTILRLLLSFEKPEKGNIYYDGNDIQKIDILDIRRRIGVVLQNGKLISGSIYENIVGYTNSSSMEDVWETAELCGIADDIEDMPMGMYTWVNEGAENISGGQRQRIILARAISKKPKLILLDEATSALDNVSQEIISRNLDCLNATRIVIAHRISTIVNCDRIYVMKNGEIVEMGKFQELMNKKGEFYNLAQRQMK